MNSNLTHAAGVIRAVLGSVPFEQAAAVAHALDTARLLVDPHRPPGTVLHRTPGGGWSRVPRPLTDLERKALDWDAACARARYVAQGIARHLADQVNPADIRVDGDRVRVVLQVDGPERWTRWRAYFGITIVGEGSRPHTVIGEGVRDGVRVTVVAHGPAATLPSAAPTAPARPFRIGDTVYDLALPLRDVHGDVWYFQGCRRQDGMPLMSVDGRPERCSLANVAAHVGPLTPVPATLPDDADPAAPPLTPVPAYGPAVPVHGPAGPVR